MVFHNFLKMSRGLFAIIVAEGRTNDGGIRKGG